MKTFGNVTCLFLVVLGIQTLSASAADLSYYRRHVVRHFSGADTLGCPLQEPSDYKPRISNFREPGCYAARPYGLSDVLYNY